MSWTLLEITLVELKKHGQPKPVGRSVACLSLQNATRTSQENTNQRISGRAWKTSLKELKTDCVDIFYLHAADRSVPFEETLQEVNKMHKEGKFVNLGLSNFTAFEVAEVVIMCKERGWVRPTIYQGVYNAISMPACLSPLQEKCSKWL